MKESNDILTLFESLNNHEVFTPPRLARDMLSKIPNEVWFDPNTHVNSQTANMAIKRMGYKDKLVSHGMRSIASTVLNEEGFDYDIIEASLAHIDKNTVRKAYNRTDFLERRRLLMQWWSDYIENAYKGSCALASTWHWLKKILYA